MAITIIIIFILIFISFLIMPVRISVFFHRINDDDHFVVKLLLLCGLIRLKFEIPYIHLALNKVLPQLGIKIEVESPDEKIKQSKETITTQEAASAYQKYRPIINETLKALRTHPKVILNFFKSLQVKRLIWNTKLSMYDAYSTGMFSGILWVFKGTITGFLTNLLTFKTKPKLAVTPLYADELIFETEFNCIFEFKIGHIMGIATILILALLKGVIKI
jgi:hypothetical protein